jgi:hypothetical protein
MLNLLNQEEVQPMIRNHLHRRLGISRLVDWHRAQGAELRVKNKIIIEKESPGEALFCLLKRR